MMRLIDLYVYIILNETYMLCAVARSHDI